MPKFSFYMSVLTCGEKNKTKTKQIKHIELLLFGRRQV